MRDAIYLIFVISVSMLIYNLWMTFIQPKIDSWISDREYLKWQEWSKQQQHTRTMEKLKYDTRKAEIKLQKLRMHAARQRKD